MLQRIKDIEFENQSLKTTNYNLAKEAIASLEKKRYSSVEERQRYQNEIRVLEGDLQYALRKADASKLFIKAGDFLNARIALQEELEAILSLEKTEFMDKCREKKEYFARILSR
jgi:5'-deoxynucleotidase YfbR-like HD superfamily hydrolase